MHMIGMRKMIEVKAPAWYDYDSYKIFLAGSIEMGVAEQWQDMIVRELKDAPATFLNPRRDDWDASWVQSIDNEQFNTQVSWELGGLECADLVIFYFDPETKSPITLLEFGLCAGLDKDMIVCCPDGFWRKGNIEMVCDRYQISLCNSKQELIYRVTKKLKLRGIQNGEPF